ncbi:hypothetical protein ABHF54_01330 [Nitrosomonas europaea]|uniref:hypothetical protein n=1 Tax=Nitrosomonas europaea TaxID=915 RepID=UPI00059BD96C|nr:hypothetical protein [Nitrosomonas europaea]SDW95962.1 hypothetical protein SAMN05216310_16214 [Nitrosomonas europaea]SET48719.1 hypothetical protein SAMN05216309_16214 [Nitrosomonas europaea]SKA05077.1 hypothetical protein SAMN02745113_02590 [Nitrosomonas europaea]
MLDNQNRIRHYRAYTRMYGEMMQDLCSSEHYITYLINNDGLNKFETGLRTLIEKSLNQPIRS